MGRFDILTAKLCIILPSAFYLPICKQGLEIPPSFTKDGMCVSIVIVYVLFLSDAW